MCLCASYLEGLEPEDVEQPDGPQVLCRTGVRWKYCDPMHEFTITINHSLDQHAPLCGPSVLTAVLVLILSTSQPNSREYT